MNKLGLLAFLVYTLFVMAKGDTLGAYEVDQAGNKEPITGFKKEKLVEGGNLYPDLTLTQVAICTIFLDKRFDGAFVPLALIVMLGALLWWPLGTLLRKCKCISRA